MNFQTIAVLTFILAFSVTAKTKDRQAQAGISVHGFASLSEQKRQSIRYRLENLANEAEVLVKNQRTDRQDVLKQEREMEIIGGYDRVPLGISQAKLTSAVEKDLRSTAAEHHLKVKHYSLSPVAQARKPIPKVFATAQETYTLTEDQVVDKFRFRVVATGSSEQAKQWIANLKENKDIPRIVLNPEVRPVGSQLEITGYVFRFRKISYPKLVPPEPRMLLPLAQRKLASENWEAFREQEPQLARWVARAETYLPSAKPLYSTREKFLLNDARLNFITSHSE